MTAFFRWILVLMAVTLTGCASTPGAGVSGTGIVQSIAESTEANQTTQVVGAIGGAVLGGWLGSNIGGGAGQTIATAAGSVAGADRVEQCPDLHGVEPGLEHGEADAADAQHRVVLGPVHGGGPQPLFLGGQPDRGRHEVQVSHLREEHVQRRGE